MDVAKLTYSSVSGWSHPLPAMEADPRTLVLAFGPTAMSDDPRPLADLARAFPAACRIGCSTSGGILGQQVVADDAMVVAIARFARTDLALASASVATPADSFAAGRAIGAELLRPGLRAVWLCSDGLVVNGSELARGINAMVPASILVTGGLAGDGSRFQRTWVTDARGVARSGVVTAVGLYGDSLRVGFGSAGGWDILGPERRITRSAGNVVYEIDGKPALALYKRYLGTRAAGLPATALLFPLSVRSGPDDPNRLVRTILGVDESAQSMTFAGDVPQGFSAQLMQATLDHLIDGSTAAAAAAFTGPDDVAGETLAVAVSCVGRRLVLGERAEEELEASASQAGPGACQVGFYSYGEVCPHPWGTGGAELHNETMTITRLAEAA
jgi:hypothetical protein